MKLLLLVACAVALGPHPSLQRPQAPLLQLNTDPTAGLRLIIPAEDGLPCSYEYPGGCSFRFESLVSRVSFCLDRWIHVQTATGATVPLMSPRQA